MSYDIVFKVKVQDLDEYIPVGDQYANITWNVGQMIRVSTGLEWNNEEDNGLVKDIIPYIEHGLEELKTYPDEYKQFESPNGWGTLGGCIHFFEEVLKDWERFKYEYPNLVDAVRFWIE